MAAFRIFRRFRQLQDVDDTGLAQGDVPIYETAVSKFTMGAPAAPAHSVTLAGNTAGALALISTGTWTLAGGANVTLSQAGNAVTISGDPGAGATATAISGISASNTLYTSGTVRISGVGGGVTVSSNTGQRVDISVAAPVAQSVQPETQTFVAGVSASNALYTSGTVRLTGVGGGVTVSSNTGQRVDISVAAPVAQSVQTQNVVDLTLSGNTAGALALVSSGTLTLAGGANVTLSQAGNAVTISGANPGGAQTGISGIANSQTTYTSGTVSLSELGAITIRSTTGNQFQLSVNSQSVQPETQTFVAGVSASDTLYTSGNVRLTGVGGGITVSSNTGQRIDLSVAAQSVQPETQTFIAGVSASNTLYTSGNVRISGSQAVTVRSGTGQLVVIDVPAQSVQPETQTFIAGVSASDTLYTSGNVRVTGVGGGITVSSNTGQRIDLSVAAQSVQTQNLHNVTLSGNTAGAMAHISSGTMTLAGGNNITVSQAGNAVTISGPNVAGAQTGISGFANSETTYTSGSVTLSALGAITIRSTTGQHFQLSVNSQSVQPETQTFIAGVSASDTLYTSGNVRVTGVGGGITVSSNTGQRIDLSVAAQTNQAGSVYASSNTFGTSSGTYDARSISIAGRGAASVAASNSGWIISVPAQSVQAETQTFLAGAAASNTTYTSGTFSITGVGGGITVSSNTGQRIDLSVAAPVAQTNQAGSVYAISNTSGTSSGTFDARTLSIAGAGMITVAASNSGWRINATQSVQAETQTFIGGISASDTLYTSGSVRITGVGGGVTVSSNTGQRVDISVAAPVAQTVQTQNLHNVTLSGNTAGAMAHISSGTMTLAGGNGITLSQAGNAVTISGGAGGAAFSAGMSTEGNTAGNTGVTGSRLVFVGSDNITLSQTTGAAGATLSFMGPASSSLSATGAVSISTDGSTISIGAPTQTNQAGSVYASSNTFGTSSGTYDARSISIAGRGAASVAASNSGWIISVPAQSVQPETQTFIAGVSASDTLYTSGNVRITGVGGGITVSSNTGQRIDLSVAAPVAQTAQTGISGIANSQTTYTSGTVSLSELGAITIRSTTGNQYQLSVNSQTVQTQGILSAGVSTGGNTVGNTTVNTGSRFVLVASGNATASQATAAGASTVTISVGTQTLQTSNVHNVTLSGNTAGAMAHISSGTLTLAGGNNITLSQAGNAVTISAPNLGAGAMSAGVSTGGNTAGATGITGTQLVFVGSNNISLSQTTGANGGTITINNTVSAFQAGVSTGGNTAGDTGVSGTRLVLVGDSPISLSQATGANGATVSIDAPATSSLSATGALEISTNGSTISLGAPNIKSLGDFQNFPLAMATLVTHAASISKTPFYFPIMLAGKMTANTFVVRLSAVTTNTLQSFSIHAGFYTLVNSTSMALLGSWSESYVLSTGTSASWSGARNYAMTGIGTHTALSRLNGGDYVIGMMFSAGAAGSMAQSIMGAGTGAGPLGVVLPGVHQLSTGTSQGVMALNGRGSSTVNALPANVVASELVNQGSGASIQIHPWIYIRS